MSNHQDHGGGRAFLFRIDSSEHKRNINTFKLNYIKQTENIRLENVRINHLQIIRLFFNLEMLFKNIFLTKWRICFLKKEPLDYEHQLCDTFLKSWEKFPARYLGNELALNPEWPGTPNSATSGALETQWDPITTNSNCLTLTKLSYWTFLLCNMGITPISKVRL